MSVETMKRKILSIAKSDGLKAGYFVNHRPFMKTILSLENEDHDDFYTAYDELKSEGIFESKENGDFLTEKGEQILNNL